MINVEPAIYNKLTSAKTQIDYRGKDIIDIMRYLSANSVSSVQLLGQVGLGKSTLV